MKSIPECLASTLHIERPVWINDVSWQQDARKWKVQDRGFYDYLVIAHNGKCADRLMSNAGVPNIHSLLRVRFSDQVNPRDARMQLCSLWVLMAAFQTSLNLPYEGAHVEHNKDITWVSNNTAKLSGPSQPGTSKQPECWTIISSRSFGSRHKVPQENIPPKKGTEVTNLLLNSFAEATGLNRANIKPCFTR